MENESLEFFLPMIPPTITAQQRQVRIVKGKPHFYEPAELEQARAKLRDHIGPHAPDEPYDVAVRLITKWCWPTNGQRPSGTYKHTRPDTDNLQKMLKDVMEELGFFANDSRVASEITEKFWADPAGIYIRVEVLA